ncbi:MAG: hypothetical protein GX098_04335 [Bacteroidales bacterium]|nr:hypothetical protein [Bacteroidales bacterium]
MVFVYLICETVKQKPTPTMKRFLFSLALVAASAMMAIAQPFVRTNSATPKIQFPDIPGFHTLVADLHTHSVFSDASVWPTVRVEEALAEGLDVISMTDHVEYHPFKKYIPEDNLASTELILNAAKNKPLIMIPGGEISATSDHFNALFINNQNDTVLKNKTPSIRIKAAKDQGGFVFWNHPGWTSRAKDGNAPVDEGFYQLMEQGQINGIEICNGDEFWPETLVLAQRYHLTLLGNSDIHGVSHYAYTPDRHRTVTLIFAKEKTPESVREALENQRTIVYCGNYLVGTPDLLTQLLTASLQVSLPVVIH